MRHTSKGLLITLIAAMPLFGEDGHQSYLSYEAGGGVVVQPGDDRPIEARENLPLYPGDQVRTSRSGRTEVRLSDNNVVAIDRDSEVLFSSMADSYDAEENETTVVRLISGKLIMHHARSNKGTPLRLDTDVATYVSTRESIYTVEADGRGRDDLVVFAGSLEVRTPGSTTRLRKGDNVRIDDEGVTSIREASQYALLDFERWYLERADQLTEGGRYLDGRLGYAESQLSSHGAWVYMNDYGSWGWRPSVSVGWRPYYNGYWHRGRSGHLVWVSYDPWGWAPYHYGRWAYVPTQGWIWIPGAAYSPAWVYWASGPSWIGWVPSGWYDCYRPYSSWLYRPYDRIGYGFYGSVRLSNVNMGPWVFVDSGTLLSNRVDRAALTTDQFRNRLARDGDRAAISRGALRLNNRESKDPTAAVRELSRRGLGGGTGNGGSGNTTDITPFFRRDPELPSTVRERVTRVAMPDSDGSRRPVNMPSVDRSGANPPAQERGREVIRDRGTAGSIDRGPAPGTQSSEPARGGETRGVVRQPAAESKDSGSTGTTPSQGTRSRVQREAPPPSPAPQSSNDQSTSDSWRSRGVERSQPPAGSTGGTGQSDTSRRPETSPSTSGSGSANDVPRRIIDRIGGARISPPPPPSTSSGDSSRAASPSSSSRRTSEPRREQGSIRVITPPSSSRSSSDSGRSRATSRESSPPRRESSSSSSRSDKPASSQSAPPREAPKQEKSKD